MMDWAPQIVAENLEEDRATQMAAISSEVRLVTRAASAP